MLCSADKFFYQGYDRSDRTSRLQGFLLLASSKVIEEKSADLLKLLKQGIPEKADVEKSAQASVVQKKALTRTRAELLCTHKMTMFKDDEMEDLVAYGFNCAQ